MPREAQTAGPIQSGQYVTGSDASVYLLDHPDPSRRRDPVEAAHFTLVAGEGPIPIWSFARTGRHYRGDDDDAPVQGGAPPFDDIAQSDHRARLQLVMATQRFEDTWGDLQPDTFIGDLQVEYDPPPNLSGDVLESLGKRAFGYYLRGGRVGGLGKQIDTRNGVFPSVSIHFEEALTIWQAKNQLSNPEEIETVTSEETVGASLWWSYDLYFREKGTRERVQYHPSAVRARRGQNLELLDEVRTQEPRTSPAAGPLSPSVWLGGSEGVQDFRSALVEVVEDGGRVLYGWNLADERYERVSGPTESPRVSAVGSENREGLLR